MHLIPVWIYLSLAVECTGKRMISSVAFPALLNEYVEIPGVNNFPIVPGPGRTVEGAITASFTTVTESGVVHKVHHFTNL